MEYYINCHEITEQTQESIQWMSNPYVSLEESSLASNEMGKKITEPRNELISNSIRFIVMVHMTNCVVNSL